MKEYVLPEQPKFKAFDKVVVKIAKGKWHADVYSHEDKEYICLLGNAIFNKECVIVLPFNEETAKLIGTNDEWKGGEE